MLIFIHITIAVTSLLVGTLAVTTPSRKKLRLNYYMIAATLISGTAVIVANHVAMLRSCTSGLTYLAVAVLLSIVAERRLTE